MSWAVIVRVAVAGGVSLPFWYTTVPSSRPSSSWLIWSRVPARMTLLVPELVMATPVVPGLTVSTPSVTAKVSLMMPPAASTSLIRKPVLCRARSVCSVAV